MLDLACRDNWTGLMECECNRCVVAGHWCLLHRAYSCSVDALLTRNFFSLFRLFQTIPARCPGWWWPSRLWTWMTTRLNWTGSTQQPCATRPPSARWVHAEAVLVFFCTFLQNDDFKPCVCVCEKMISNIIFQLIVLEQAFCLFDNGTVPVKIDAGL